MIRSKLNFEIFYFLVTFFGKSQTFLKANEMAAASTPTAQPNAFTGMVPQAAYGMPFYPPQGGYYGPPQGYYGPPQGYGYPPQQDHHYGQPAQVPQGYELVSTGQVDHQGNPLFTFVRKEMKQDETSQKLKEMQEALEKQKETIEMLNKKLNETDGKKKKKTVEDEAAKLKASREAEAKLKAEKKEADLLLEQKIQEDIARGSITSWADEDNEETSPPEETPMESPAPVFEPPRKVWNDVPPCKKEVIARLNDDAPSSRSEKSKKGNFSRVSHTSQSQRRSALKGKEDLSIPETDKVNGTDLIEDVPSARDVEVQEAVSSDEDAVLARKVKEEARSKKRPNVVVSEPKTQKSSAQKEEAKAAKPIAYAKVAKTSLPEEVEKKLPASNGFKSRGVNREVPDVYMSLDLKNKGKLEKNGKHPSFEDGTHFKICKLNADIRMSDKDQDGHKIEGVVSLISRALEALKGWKFPTVMSKDGDVVYSASIHNKCVNPGKQTKGGNGSNNRNLVPAESLRMVEIGGVKIDICHDIITDKNTLSNEALTKSLQDLLKNVVLVTAVSISLFTERQVFEDDTEELVNYVKFVCKNIPGIPKGFEFYIRASAFDVFCRNIYNKNGDIVNTEEGMKAMPDTSLNAIAVFLSHYAYLYATSTGFFSKRDGEEIRTHATGKKFLVIATKTPLENLFEFMYGTIVVPDEMFVPGQGKVRKTIFNDMYQAAFADGHIVNVKKTSATGQEWENEVYSTMNHTKALEFVFNYLSPLKENASAIEALTAIKNAGNFERWTAAYNITSLMKLQQTFLLGVVGGAVTPRLPRSALTMNWEEAFNILLENDRTKEEHPGFKFNPEGPMKYVVMSNGIDEKKEEDEVESASAEEPVTIYTVKKGGKKRVEVDSVDDEENQLVATDEETEESAPVAVAVEEGGDGDM